jgi:tryptophan-rich sensory protein
METRMEWERVGNELENREEWDEPDDLRPDVLDSDDLDVDIIAMSDDGESMEEGTRSNGASGLALASFAGLTVAAAALGRVASRRAPGLWYRTLRKPPFQPPSWVFGPVWSTLYGLIATSGYRVWKTSPSKARTQALTLWGTQLALNSAWSPLFFGARRKRTALVDLLALLGVVAAYAQVSRKIDKPAAAMVLPYLGWLGFAGALNEEIIRRNRGWRRWFGS